MYWERSGVYRILVEKPERKINRSIFYVSTTFILINNNWTTCFDCYSVILRSFSKVVSYRELCAHWDPKCVYIKT